MTETGSTAAKFEPNWESLISYGIPEWMLDAKFGIYAHWGLYSVPGFGNEWYGKRMYDPNDPVHAEHVRHFGHLSKFGYKDFIPRFTAEHYDPDAWADLFRASGARYAGFSLAHHDGFGLWDSDVYKWNVGKMGPKRDLYGELASALKKRDMRLVAPFHIIRGYDWFLPGSEAVEQGQRERWDIFDPQYKDFYWTSVAGAKFEAFFAQWKAKVIEVLDKYEPDLIWFDGGQFREGKYEAETLSVLCHYLNQSVRWNKRVCVLNKLPVSKKYNFHPDFGVLNYESGRDRDSNVQRPWNDDMRIGLGSWGYVEGQTYLTGSVLLHNLIDRVSRGGSLMLSLSPRPDGTIPEGQQKPLRELGTWLAGYGEAVYGTRAWKLHGEGNDDKPREGGGAHRRWKLEDCSADDKRYTQSKDGRNLYAMALGWTGDQIAFKALGKSANLLDRPIQSVTSLDGHEVKWQRNDNALTIDPSGTTPTSASRLASVWKVSL